MVRTIKEIKTPRVVKMTKMTWMTRMINGTGVDEEEENDEYTDDEYVWMMS